MPPQAWRWQLLLRARGIDDSLRWLTRAYFVSYAVGQVLPTAVGGDASRIYETTRRHPGFGSPIAGSVLLERAIGGAVTLVLAAIGFLLAIGRYPIGAYLWIEAGFVVATVLAAVVALLGLAPPPPALSSVPLLRRLARRAAGAGPPTRGSTATATTSARCSRSSAITTAAQISRILAIWASGRVGRDRPLAAALRRARPAALPRHARPVHVNGLGVREAFFVSFLGQLGVNADAAFATGFLFFLMTLLLAAARPRRPPLGGIPAGPGAGRRCADDVSVVVVTWNAAGA